MRFIKKLTFILIIASTFIGYSQIDFGIKGGINYNSNGDLVANNGFESFFEESRGRVGFYAGLWLRKDIAKKTFYIQPELVYSFTKSTYVDFSRTDYTLKNINIPVLIGKRIFSFCNIHAGPVLSFNLDSDFKSSYTFTDDISTDSFGVGLNIGISIEFNKFGLDIRWERGLSKTESRISNSTIFIDSRSNQLIAGLYYRLN